MKVAYALTFVTAAISGWQLEVYQSSHLKNPPGIDHHLSHSAPSTVNPAHGPSTDAKDIILGEDPIKAAEEWASRDPHRFFKWLNEIRPQPDRGIVDAFFKRWIELDPSTAFTAALELPERFGYSGESLFFTHQLTALMSRDLAEGLKWIDKFSPQLGGTSPLLELGGFVLSSTQLNTIDLNSVDPEFLLAKLNGCVQNTATVSLLDAYVRSLAQTDLADALSWAERLSPEHQVNALIPLYTVWMERDPIKALEHLANASSPTKQLVSPRILPLYAKQDAWKAIQWTQENLGANGYYLFYEWANQDATAAQNYVFSLSNPQLNELALTEFSRAMMTTWNVRDYSKVLPWVESLPQEAQHTALESIFDNSMVFLTPHVLTKLETMDQNDPNTIELGKLMGSHAARSSDEMMQSMVQWCLNNDSPTADQTLLAIAESFNHEGCLTKDLILSSIPPGPKLEYLRTHLGPVRSK